ncbi:MAG TPA: DUF4112 domain-containing protein [Vicinamibacterales bacterium]|nr:DUF4112 domain-containing protein [Vicinamibacterales bacterium]
MSTSRGGNQRGLELLRRWARIFDSAFRIPGTRITFGLDPIIGLIPGIGDLSSPIFSLFIIWHAAKLRVPRVVIARMVLNALIDGLVGAIPVVGDLFDFAWKASAWNLALLERHAMPGTPARRSDWIFVALCVGVVVVVALIPLVLAVWLLRHVNLF